MMACCARVTGDTRAASACVFVASICRTSSSICGQAASGLKAHVIDVMTWDQIGYLLHRRRHLPH